MVHIEKISLLNESYKPKGVLLYFDHSVKTGLGLVDKKYVLTLIALTCRQT